MPRFLPNDSVAQNRRGGVVLYQDDGVTRIAATTAVLGTKALRALGGLTGNLSGVILTRAAVGVSGNSYTLAITADGAGAGSLTNSGTNYTFHYATGVTTVTNFQNAIVAIFTMSGTFTGSNTLQAGDATAALTFAGGTDSSLFVRPGNTVTEATATGALTSILRSAVAQAGRFEYEFTQTELNHSACKTMLAFDRVADAAMLDLSTKTTHCGTIIYDKVAVGANGNASGGASPDPQTIAFLNDGAGAGTLNNSGAAWTFHYASSTTTVKNFEDAIVASSRFAIFKYSTNWTTLLVHAADTFTATNLSGGVGYAFQEINFDMRAGDFDNTCENGRSYGDMTRKIAATTANTLAGPYAGGSLTGKSDDGAKTRVTWACDGTQRVATTGDLTP
jgi:hypothetical protein